MKFRVAGLSDVGRCRAVNQDHYLVDPSSGLYAVADGMGGHAAGEVASRIAIETLSEVMRRENGSSWNDTTEAARALEEALAVGNRRICESTASHAEWRGMGTTIVAAVTVNDRIVLGHVGDSRAYLLRDGRLRQLTSDHSLVNEQVKMGLLTWEEAQRHPHRNIVTRALGNQPQVAVDLVEESLHPGDAVLLCSDGLNSMLVDAEIRDALDQHRATPHAACRLLVERANASGGEDNVTVIVLCPDPTR
jgi:protein phosphatase